jgi:hypothetical protein
MTDPNNPYLNQAPPTNGPMGGSNTLLDGIRGLSPIGSLIGGPKPMGPQAGPMGMPMPPVASPMPQATPTAMPIPQPPGQIAGAPAPVPQIRQPIARPDSGFQPKQMVTSQGPARGAQMERMARPAGARRGLQQAKATGNIPGMGGPPKPPQY